MARDPKTFDRRLLVPMVLGSLLNPINSSIIAVSLVPIGRAFHAPTSDTTWLVSALYLATATGQPVVGRLVDLYGPRRLFIAGSTLTGIAGVIGTLAPSLGVLIAARVILGFGTCAGYPAAMSLIRREADRTGEESPSTVLTILAVSSQTIVVIGPTLGGLLIGAGGWRTTLAINVPLAAASLWFGWRRLPRDPIPPRPEGTGPLGGLDVQGIALFVGMLVALLLWLMEPGLGDLWLLAVVAAFAIGLARRELRVEDPFIDLRELRRNGPLVRTYLRAFVAQTVGYSVLYGVTQWLQDGRGLSATTAGLILLPLSATGLVVSATTGRRPEIRGKLVVGAGAQIVGCVLLLFLAPSSPIVVLLLVAAVFGVPQGLTNLANQNALYFQADPERIGAFAGLLRTFLYLGAIASSAAAAGFFGRSADTAGLHHLAVFLLAFAVVFLVLTVADRSLGRVGRDGAEAVAR